METSLSQLARYQCEKRFTRILGWTLLRLPHGPCGLKAWSRMEGEDPCDRSRRPRSSNGRAANQGVAIFSFTGAP